MIKRLKPRNLEEAKRNRSDLERKAALWRNPDFQWWIERIEKSMGKLEEANWMIDGTEASRILTELGVPEIGGADDLLSLFLQARAVVRSWRKRLRPLREAEAALKAETANG